MRQATDKQIYVNEKQMALIMSRQPTKVWIGGRGSGKSTVHGALDYMRVMHLPGAKWFKAGLTYNQILTKFLPPMIEYWSSIGLVEWQGPKRPGHYAIGRKPPDGWRKPYSPPQKFENVISFFNGCAIELLSMDRPDLSRGGTYDGGDYDEAVLIKKEQHDKELRPSIRARDRWGHHLHRCSLYTSTQSWLPSGNWVPDKALDAVSHPDEVFYIESTAFDNIHVLGQRYLDNLKRDLPSLIWDVEVMNLKPQSIPNGFYAYFNESKHCYWKSFDYDEGPSGIYTKGASDIIQDKPLELGFDFGSFNSLVVGQLVGNELRAVDAMFVNNPRILDDLVDAFIEAYQSHGRKHVDIYGDRNGNNRQPNSQLTLYEEIKERLGKAGWTSKLHVSGLDPAHHVKYRKLNQLLKEDNPRWPVARFNQNKCKYLLLSMGEAKVTAEGKKDKRSERQATVKPELATHLSDAWDNWAFRRLAQLIKGGGGKPMEPGWF